LEVPATVNHTWGFKKDDTDWKAPGDILFKLVDIASKAELSAQRWAHVGGRGSGGM